MPLATITTLEPFNINNSATFTFASTSITANVSAGNILTDNILYANGLPWSFGSTYSNTNVAAYLPTYSGLVGGTLSSSAQPNITSLGTLSSLTVTGLITATAGGVKVGNLQDPTGTNTIQLLNSNVSVTGDITAGVGGTGNVTATYFIGNGSQLTGLPASYSNTNVAAYLPTYTGNYAGNNVTLTGNISTGSGSGNISGANYVIANYFQGDGSLLTGLPSAYSNANVAAYLPTYTGNFTAGNISTTGNVTAAYFIGDGSQLTGLPAGYSNANVAAYLPTYTGNLSANVITANNATINGSITTGSGTGNISGANFVNANYFTGDGSLLSSITGSNVTGTVSSATTAATVTTAAQPNITSVGTLTDATVSGNVVISGNLTVSGTTEYTNVTNLYVKDPIIEMGGNSNGGVLTSNDGKDRGTLLHYFTTTTVDAFMGWDNSNSEFGFGSNVTVSSEVVTWNSYGNVRVGNIIGNGQALTGLTGSNVTGQVANALVAGTVYTAAQPNITSVGTLSSVAVSGLTTATGGLKTGNIQDTTGTNTISVSSATVGVIGNLTVGTGGSGNLTATYVIGNGSALTSITGGNVTGQVANALVAGTVYTNAQPNITSVGTLASLSVTGNITAGNINGGNAIVANYFVGDGSLLTGLPASYSNTNVAAYLPTYTGNFSPSNLVVSTSANLGSVGNVIITGGTANYVLSTDGAGTLSWVAQTGGGGGGGGTGLAIGSVEVFTADGSGNTYTLTTTPSNEDQLTVNIDGVIQLHSSFSLAGNVVTLAGIPVNGAKVEITNFNSGGAAGSNTQIQFNDSGNIAGSAALTFNKTSNTLNATNITANGTPVATTGKAIAMSIVFGG